MPNTRKVLSSLSFIIRLWFDIESPHNLRGRITRVKGQRQNEQKSFSELSEINNFIERSLEQEGVVVKQKRRIWFWSRRKQQCVKEVRH